MRRIGLFTLAGALLYVAGPYSMGQIVSVLPAGCITPNVGSGNYYLCAAIRGSARRMAPVACITR